MVDIRLSVDWGPDTGESWGTLFEARDRSGRTIAGAGFCGVYNTVFANDRYGVQFFIRSTDAQQLTFQSLPRSTTDAGTYLFDLGGRLYAKAPSGKPHPKGWFVMSETLSSAGDEKALLEWNPERSCWTEAELLDGRRMRIGDCALRVQDGVLTLEYGRICYNCDEILPSTASGFYHHLYYAGGKLVFFETTTDAIIIHACPWSPQSGGVELSESHRIKLARTREYPLCYGQWQNDILVFTNLGGTYRLRENQWEILRSPNNESYQIYSAISTQSRLLLAHYPSGHLLSYAGDAIEELANWPPRLPGVSAKVREAQTTMLFGGYLYVGVWPWAELWRMDLNSSQWEFIQRLFPHPEVNDEFDHPYEREIVQYNLTQGKDFVPNGWGQRITSMTPLHDSLYISTSAKWNWPCETEAPFLSKAQREHYGQILQMNVAGVLTGTVRWKKQRTEFAFEIDEHHMRIRQDRNLIAQRTVSPNLASQFATAAMSWGNGQFGKFAGTLVPTIVKL